MTANEKIQKALDGASACLKTSIVELSKKNDESYADRVWHVGAELEYALFLFSMMFPDESSVSKRKPNPELKNIDTATILTDCQNLLDEAGKQLATGKLKESYKTTYMARHYILKVQEDIAKKKREAFKQKEKA
jgi:hypothetical protein